MQSGHSADEILYLIMLKSDTGQCLPIRMSQSSFLYKAIKQFIPKKVRTWPLQKHYYCCTALSVTLHRRLVLCNRCKQQVCHMRVVLFLNNMLSQAACLAGACSADEVNVSSVCLHFCRVFVILSMTSSVSYFIVSQGSVLP